MTINELLRSLPKRRREDGIWLLSAKLGLTRSGLVLEGSRALEENFLAEWKKNWARRMKGEPLQYIAGRAPFYGREFLVNKAVLIPRPETESLVELTLSLLPETQPARVLDIGTGSGAIAITLKLERPAWELTATDKSVPALAVAKKNAEALNAQIQFGQGNLFFPALQRRAWEIVVSNPPYLDLSRDRITREVKEWEPKGALEPSADQKLRETKDRGLWCAERILAACEKSRVRFTAMELSARGARSLEAKWRKHPRVEWAERRADLAGRKRFLLVAWKNA